jgi:hypothetical protein
MARLIAARRTAVVPRGGAFARPLGGAGAKLRELANTALGFLTKTRWTRSFHLPS